mmetsp:Transcript_5849/g.17618  ORF Transcript_5849/g.17618 Transcript_5849/m.17618 type:complete len:260 (-) Transcript_5849:967-1746(-)
MTFREAPCETMKSRSAATETPRRTTPWIVGKRGSSQPSTTPLSTSQASLRFDMRVLTKLIREKAWISTLRSPIASCSQAYWASRSLYSVVRNACVTPSIESTTGHAMSYVGYALYRVPVRWWGVAFARNRTGSRSVPLSLVMSIFARRHHSGASPAHIAANRSLFVSIEAFRCRDSTRCSRSAFIVSCGESSMNALPSSSSRSAYPRIASKWSDVCDRFEQSIPSVSRSAMMLAANSSFSLDGFVSSNLTRSLPSYRRA